MDIRVIRSNGNVIDIPDAVKIIDLETSSEGIELSFGQVGHLTATGGVFNGPSGKETYYNLPMDNVIDSMKEFGYSFDDYHVDDRGVKMLGGNYIMCAADLEKFPRGTILETSLGTAIVCDACEEGNIDIAVTW